MKPNFRAGPGLIFRPMKDPGRFNNMFPSLELIVIPHRPRHFSHIGRPSDESPLQYMG
jgi:hypothetical protein